MWGSNSNCERREKEMTESGSKNWKNKKVIVIVVILLGGILIGAFLYAWYYLKPEFKPEFNTFDMEKSRGSVNFNIQNIGKADAHNITIKVNGTWTWIPTFRMDVTSVEHGYVVTPGQIATVFYGTIYGGEWMALADRIVPSIVGGETDGATYVKIMVMENDVMRYLTENENVALIEAFENPRAYHTYTFGETTIDILRKGEIKTVVITLEKWSTKTTAITLEQYPDFYEISISCDEGITLQFSP